MSSWRCQVGVIRSQPGIHGVINSQIRVRSEPSGHFGEVGAKEAIKKQFPIKNKQNIFRLKKRQSYLSTRGPNGHISYTWVQCAYFLTYRQGRTSCFSDRPKNTNLVTDVEILLSLKFREIPFSGFRGEVKNDSAN